MPRKKTVKEIKAEIKEVRKQMASYEKEHKALTRQASVIANAIQKKEARLIKLEEWLEAA